MRYDLDLLHEFCCEIGLAAHRTDEKTLQVLLGDGAILCFENADQDDDCLLGFADTPWHTHWDMVFADREGHLIELDSLDLLSQLKDGKVLVCERQIAGQVTDRWLTHSKFNDEFGGLQPGEKIIVRRAIGTVEQVVR